LVVGIKKDFWGFRKVLCSNCDTENTLPLSTAYKIVYYIFTLIGIISLFVGGISVLALVYVFILFKNNSLEKKYSQYT